MYHSVITTVVILSPTSGRLNATRGLIIPTSEEDMNTCCNSSIIQLV